MTDWPGKLLLSMLAALVAVEGARADEPYAPDFALRAADGYNYRLSEYRGEVVALVFWASWCGGCRRELERLQQLSDVYRDAGLRVIAVSVDDRPEAARSIAAAAGITYPVLLDTDKSVARAYDPPDLPATWLIDRSGRLRFAQRAADPRPDGELLAQLRALLDE